MAIANVAIMAPLDAAWEAIRDLHPDVPEAKLALPGTIAARTTHRLGHWSGSSFELAVYDRALDGTYNGAELLGVLLHESTHAVCDARGIQDGAPTRSSLHNARFAEVAAELGLYLPSGRPADKGADTICPAATTHYKRVIARLDKALTEINATAA